MSKCTLPRLQYQDQYQDLLDALREAYTSSSPNLSDPLNAYPGARALLDEYYSEEDAMQPSPEDALEYLLDVAIDRFGCSARDVYGAVFQYPDMIRQHEDAFNITYDGLRHAVSALSRNQGVDNNVSQQILTLRPVDQGFLMGITWDVDFKSDWVARSVLQRLWVGEDNNIREEIRLFRSIPKGGALVRRLPEPLAH